jgi:hypothetical protein
MYKRGRRDAQLRWYAACLLLAAPIGVWAMNSSDPWHCLVGLFCFVLLVQPLPACAYAALNLVTPGQLRATGVALFVLTSGLVGIGLGSMLMAAAAEYLFGGAQFIGLGIATVAAVCCPLGALCMMLGFGAMREAVATAERGELHAG